MGPRHRNAAIFAVAAAVTSATAGAQEPTTATIAGVVVSTDAAAPPIRGAVVTLSGGDIVANLGAITDDRGRFAFRQLRPGRYSLSASKPAYLTTAYGATRPGRPGTSIAVGAGARVDLRMVLPRGAVITGTIRDHLGQPAPGVQVTISPADQISGPSGYRPSNEALLSDDRGVYREYGLAPGEYVVSAVPRISSGGEIFQMTSGAIDATLRKLQLGAGSARATPTSGVAPVAAVAPAGGETAAPTQPYGFAPTFYPGTTVASDAARIVVAAGEERGGVDISLAPVRAARVSGVIVSGDIPPSRLRPSMTVIGPPQPTFATPRLNGPREDGTFTFENVTPGRYVLTVRSGPGASMTLTDGRIGTTTNNPGVPAMFATTELSIDGADVTGITLSLRPALTVAGRITFDASTLTPPEKLTAVRVTLVAPGGNRPATVLNGVMGGDAPPPSTMAAADGTFKLEAVMSGTYGITSVIPGAGAKGWWLRSAIVGGRDLLDHPLELGPTSPNVTDAVLTFSDRHSELAGVLTAASGQPASEYTVVVYPADQALWRPGARRIRSVRPGNDGAFSVSDLPAGDYLIAALTDVEPDEWQQPAFLRQLVPASVKVAIADGQLTRQDLRIAR
jgi:hypothetical protein